MHSPSAIRIYARPDDRHDEVLTEGALAFVANLNREFSGAREALLVARRDRRQRIAEGEHLDFLSATERVRTSNWKVADPAPGLLDRRVEITGPSDKRMAVNALNSGAKVWLADFEDACVPLWSNLVEGQLNLADALNRTIDFETAEGRKYQLRPDEELPTMVVRPRGWHLEEKHMTEGGRPVSASLFDFGLHYFHNAERLLSKGRGPYFYLPKLESHLEARLWRDVFVSSEDALALPRGTIRATVLIETLPAAFEMDEILYELREHSAGLNAGRWDYLFSAIKTLGGKRGDFVLPDRRDITMTAPSMRAYARLLVQTCHRRGAHAIGGMAAFVPSRTDSKKNAQAMALVRQDKEREADDGFDGSWVAHPDMVQLCREVFDAALGTAPHQMHRGTAGPAPTAEELLSLASTPGEITEAGLRNNISVAIQYLESWLRGVGAVAIFGLMEDAATAEIARSQVWQWIQAGANLADGSPVTRARVVDLIDEEIAKLGDERRYAAARQLFERVALDDELCDFLTLPAYAELP